MTPLFFQSNQQQLFAMYHRARGCDRAAKRAVLICSPIGQEYVRTHWCLRLLAGQLARHGVHVLRFDYSGQGDSSGSIDEVQSVETWQQDVVSAIEVLQQRSGASSVMLAGLRTGAALATAVASMSDQVNSLFLWEPIHKGCDYLAEQRRLHNDMLDLWVCKMRTENSLVAEEILGSRYSRPLLDSLEQSQIAWHQIEQPNIVFDVKNQESFFAANASPMRKVELTDDEQSWCDLRQLETAWLRPQTTRRIVDQVVDVFGRLEKFGVLIPNEGVMA